MGEVKKVRRKLGKFLKDKEPRHSRKGLMKLGFSLGSAVLLFNVVLSSSVLAAHTNTAHSNAPHNNVPTLTQSPVAGTDCYRIEASHTDIAHTNTPHTNINTY